MVLLPVIVDSPRFDVSSFAPRISTRSDGTRGVMIATALRRNLPSCRGPECRAEIHPHTPSIPALAIHSPLLYQGLVEIGLTDPLVITRAPRHAHHSLYPHCRGVCQ